MIRLNVPVITFTIDELPLLPNRKGQGRHWAVEDRYRKAWYWRVRCAIGRRRPRKPYQRAQITLTRRSNREPDADNLFASWKPVIDGLCVAGVIVDDSPAHVTVESVWERAKRGKGEIEVIVVAYQA